ncbi:DUF4157 domain-containing protein [Myxococcota bacterium]|nr:DUF4157 domain-containing protein [Myxococcota bacterium]
MPKQRAPGPGLSAPSPERASSAAGPSPAPGGRQPRGNGQAQDRVQDRVKARGGAGGELRGRMQGSPSSLPYREQVEALLGVDLGGVQAFLGQQDELARRGADAAASGDVIAFADTSPTLEQVVHEVVHLVQELEHGPAAPGTQSRPGDASERESRRLGGQARAGRPGVVREKPAGAVQRDESDQWQEARRRALEIKDALLDHWDEDEQKALRQIRGQSTLMLREIRAQYLDLTGHVLENDFQELCDDDEYREALGLLWQTMSLFDRLRSNVDEGWLWDSENEDGMLDVLRASSAAELATAAADPRVLAFLRGALDDDEYYQARKLMTPDNLYGVVLERVRNAEGFFNDDEDAVYNVVLELSPADRQRLWNDNPGLFDYMNEDEKQSVRRLCLGTEAQALAERMTLATDGLGTDDDAVAMLTQRAQDAATEERTIQAALAAGTLPDGTPLTETQRATLQGRLAELGGISTNLLSVQRDGDGEVQDGTFLGNLRGDVSEEEFQSFAGQMGADRFELAKQRVLDAVGFWNDDEDAINRAFTDLVPQPDLRARLWADPEVQRALGRALNQEEMSLTQTFATGDTYAVALERIREAYEGVDTDEEGLFSRVCAMSADDRARMLREQPAIWQTMMNGGSLTAQEKEMLRQAAQNGRIPTQMAIDWTFGGDWDGTEDEMIAQMFGALTTEERAQYRLGYWLSREQVTPAEPAEVAALEAFQALYARMRGELGDDALQTAMDQLIGLPTAQELQTESGRAMAAAIMRYRMQDKVAVGGGLGEGFTSTDESSDQAAAQLDSAYRAAMEDGQISEDELAVLASLDARFAQRYQEAVAASDMIASIAGMVAAIAAGILVTFLTGGTAGPAVGSLLSQYGAAALAGGVAGAAAKVTTAEVMGGGHYDATGGEGARDLATGFIDGATAVLSAGLAARFTNMIGLSRGALAAEMTVGVVETTSGAIRYAGQNFAGGAIRGAIEGFLAGAVGEVVMTAADNQTWSRSVWDVICSFGAAILRGGGIGAATGGLVGGAAEGLSAFVEARRLPGLLTDLEAAGLARVDLDGMGMDVVQGLGAADNALAGGRVEDAERIFRSLEGRLGADQLGRVRRSLMAAHGIQLSTAEAAALRIRQLAQQGAFAGNSYHGTSSDMLDGLEQTDGQILSAEDLYQRNVAQTTGEGDTFSGASGRKTFISVGQGEAGFGTSLAYADATLNTNHYNVQRYTFDELQEEIRRLQTIVQGFDEGRVQAIPMLGMDRGKFASRLSQLNDEMAIRMRFPADSARRLGGPQNLQNYPILFEFDANGLAQRSRSDVVPGGPLGGEGWVDEAVDLRSRLVRVYVPEANISDAQSRLARILGHSNFEVLPMEAVDDALDATSITQASRTATQGLHGQLEGNWQQSQQFFHQMASQ